MSWIKVKIRTPPLIRGDAETCAAIHGCDAARVSAGASAYYSYVSLHRSRLGS